jgi:V/A-type H+-transporting ATPase subunit I
LIEKMKLVWANGDLPHLDAFLKACCMQGDFDPCPATQYMSSSMGYISLNEENPYIATQTQIETMAKEIGLPLPGADHHTALLDTDAPAYLEKLGAQFSRLRAERASLLDQKRSCEEGIEQYSHFTNMRINVDELVGCTHVAVRFGFLPMLGYNKLQRKYADDPYILFMPCAQEKNGYWGVYITPRSKAQETDGIFSMLYFERMRMPGAAGTPDQIVANFEANLKVVEQSLADVDARSKKLWQENVDKVDTLYDTSRYLSSMFSLRKFAAVKKNYFYYVGWVPESCVERVTTRAQAVPSIRITVDTDEAGADLDSADQHVPPTKLKNHWWAKPFEFFVTMYGLPAYGEMDITVFVALSYTVLFGIMFGDVGQGLVLVVVSWLLWHFKHSELFHLMIPCGIASMAAGFVFGSFFGYEHVLDPLYLALGLPGKPVEVMDSINGILLFSIFTGVFLVVAAMLLNIFSCLRRRRWGSALFDTNGVLGVVTYLSGVCLATNFMGGKAPISDGLAGMLLTIGVIALLLQGVLAPMFNGEKWQPEEGWGSYFMEAFFETFESILSYLSNTVSFLRVGAFVLVHAGMMSVVFTLAGDPANLIVVILGNAVVLCLEALLSGIQGIRLEFYEMFSRCYTGGGRAFVAMDTETALKKGKETA